MHSVISWADVPAACSLLLSPEEDLTLHGADFPKVDCSRIGSRVQKGLECGNLWSHVSGRESASLSVSCTVEINTTTHCFFHWALIILFILIRMWRHEMNGQWSHWCRAKLVLWIVCLIFTSAFNPWIVKTHMCTGGAAPRDQLSFSH